MTFFRLVKAIALTTLLSLGFSGFSQEESSNLVIFTPSALLPHGQYEAKFFNNIYSQTQMRDREGNPLNLNGRQTFLRSSLQFTYGISKSDWINAGFDVVFSRAKYGVDESVLSILGGDATYLRTAMSALGPRIKIRPLRTVPRLSFQTAFLIPISANLESPRFVAHDRYSWISQFYFDQSVGSKFQIFLEAAFWMRFKRYDHQDNFFRTPLSIFVNYFPSSKFTGFLVVQYAPAFGTYTEGDQSEYGLIKWFSQVGLGAKYQASRRLELELSVSDFVASRNDGAGNTLNFGIRYIR